MERKISKKIDPQGRTYCADSLSYLIYIYIYGSISFLSLPGNEQGGVGQQGPLIIAPKNITFLMLPQVELVLSLWRPLLTVLCPGGFIFYENNNP